MIKVMNQLLRAKYTIANTINAGRIAFIDVGRSVRGAIRAMRKKRLAEHHTETAGADMLKRARCGSGYRLAIQNEMTSPSRATITVPAAGPNNKTAVNTKVSEIEMEAYEEGSLTVAEPLMSVSAAIMNHS
jgi:hypothetical protein